LTYVCFHNKPPEKILYTGIRPRLIGTAARAGISKTSARIRRRIGKRNGLFYQFLSVQKQRGGQSRLPLSPGIRSPADSARFGNIGAIRRNNPRFAFAIPTATFLINRYIGKRENFGETRVFSCAATANFAVLTKTAFSITMWSVWQKG
jgi:hypothetical protein